MTHLGLPGWLSGKESACQCRDTGSIPGSRSPGEGNGNPLQCFFFAREILWTEEFGALQSMRWQRTGHD